MEFADTNLETAVREELDIPDGDITRKDMLSLTAFEAQSSEIEFLDGLEYATNLKSLWLSSNAITDISPLAKLANLERLRLESNSITDVSPLIENEDLILEFLDINSNPLSSAAYSEHIPKLENRGPRILHEKPGGIYGTVFHSQNGEGMEGITVFLDIDQDGEHDSWEMSTTTSSDGNYSFAPIGPYDYQIRIISEDKWSVESPADGYHPVSLPEAEEIKGEDFVLTRE